MNALRSHLLRCGVASEVVTVTLHEGESYVLEDGTLTPLRYVIEGLCHPTTATAESHVCFWEGGFSAFVAYDERGRREIYRMKWVRGKKPTAKAGYHHVRLDGYATGDTMADFCGVFRISPDRTDLAWVPTLEHPLTGDAAADLAESNRLIDAYLEEEKRERDRRSEEYERKRSQLPTPQRE